MVKKNRGAIVHPDVSLNHNIIDNNEDQKNEKKNSSISLKIIRNLSNYSSQNSKCDLDLNDQLEILKAVSYFNYFMESIKCCSNKKNMIIKLIDSSKSKKKFSFKEYIKIYCSNLDNNINILHS